MFLIIGICHPIVIKLEYYWGKQSWWVMALAGVIFSLISLKRVLRGWFPENPKRHDYYERIRSKK